MYDIIVTDADTGEAVYDVEYNVAQYNGRLIVNLINFGDTKDVYIYENGTLIESGTELRSGEETSTRIILKKYAPIMIKVKNDDDTQKPNVKNIGRNNMTVYWDYGDDGDYLAAVYKLDDDGNAVLKGKTYRHSYVCESEGSYIVRAIQEDGSEEKGMIITVSEDMPFETVSDNVKVSGGRFVCDIAVKNQKSFFASGTVAVKIKNEDGGVLRHVYNKITAEPFGEKRFRITLDKEPFATEVEILTLDARTSENLYAETIIFDLKTEEMPNTSDEFN